METVKTFERFPLWIVIVSNVNSLLIYLAGFFIMSDLGMALGLLYIAFVLYLEFRIVRHHCINCFYWGKTCAFGKGNISAIFFRKGSPERFCEKQMEWKDMIPDMAVSLIPVITGIILLIVDFNVLILSSTILIALLSTSGNAFVRGKLACRYCKQRIEGCPAEKLFSKEKIK